MSLLFFMSPRPPSWNSSNALPPPPRQTPTQFCFCFSSAVGQGHGADRRRAPPSLWGRATGPHRGLGRGKINFVRCATPQTTEARGWAQARRSARASATSAGGKGRPPWARGAGARPGAPPHLLGGEGGATRRTPSELLVFEA